MVRSCGKKYKILDFLFGEIGSIKNLGKGLAIYRRGGNLLEGILLKDYEHELINESAQHT